MDDIKKDEKYIQGSGNQLSYPLDSVSTQIIQDIVASTSSNEVHGMEVFTSDGTFTVPQGVKYIIAEGVGGGSGSGGTTSTPSTGTSGGGGAYCRSLIEVTPGESITVTVGVGGAGASSGNNPGTDGEDTTFGSYWTAGGGQNDGSGGTATGADINIPGGVAGPSYTLYGAGSTTNSAQVSGYGGGSFFGQGAPGTKAEIAQQTAGTAATIYGGGASAGATGSAGSTVAGAAGKDGIVIVTY